MSTITFQHDAESYVLDPDRPAMPRCAASIARVAAWPSPVRPCLVETDECLFAWLDENGDAAECAVGSDYGAGVLRFYRGFTRSDGYGKPGHGVFCLERPKPLRAA